MKYLLFINFSSGLRHNNVYDTLDDVIESIIQLVQDEGLKVKKEKISNTVSIRKHLEKNDDYFGQLSNGTWYHVQPHPIFA